MSSLVYYVAPTLDGFIANQQHKLDWLERFALGDDATAYNDFLSDHRGSGRGLTDL